MYPGSITAGNIYALNASTGAVLWSYTAGFWNTSPVIVDGVLYTVAGDLPSCTGPEIQRIVPETAISTPSRCPAPQAPISSCG